MTRILLSLSLAFVCLGSSTDEANDESPKFGPDLEDYYFNAATFSTGSETTDIYFSKLYAKYENLKTILDGQPCGPVEEEENRVVNGIFTAKGKFPWLVKLLNCQISF